MEREETSQRRLSDTKGTPNGLGDGVSLRQHGGQRGDDRQGPEAHTAVDHAIASKGYPNHQDVDDDPKCSYALARQET